MFHVPGRYSGGEAASGLFSWTQTLQEVNLKAALPDGTPAGAVRCTFAARKLEVAWGGSDVAPTLTGELSAVVVVDDCLWTVERDGAGKAELLITLRKAVPAVWDRLLATDPAPEAAPELLDGVGREAPENKAEMLRVAKARAARDLEGPSRAKAHAVEGLKRQELSLSRAEMPELPVIAIRGCEGCTITLPADVSAIKLQLEQCSDCRVVVAGRLLTELVETWECTGCTVRLETKASTVQSDKCTDLGLSYAAAAYFDRIMHTGTRQLRVSFDDAPERGATLDFDALQQERPEMVLDEGTDQFISRLVDGGGGGGGGALVTELVIRLCNDFPTTEREVRQFEERTRMHAEQLDELASGMLGSSLGRTLTEAERDQMSEMVRKHADEASAARVVAEQTAEGRHAARVDFKKNEGNAAFKAGEYQQAAVLYTEAIALDAKQHALHSNRAACFLKLARYEQAKDDALACVALAPEFAKGHFRLGLALQALERFPEACATFTKVLALDPKNKEAAAGLNMSRMQAERQARAAAGQGTG